MRLNPTQVSDSSDAMSELDKLLGVSVSDELDEKKERLLYDENEEV